MKHGHIRTTLLWRDEQFVEVKLEAANLRHSTQVVAYVDEITAREFAHDLESFPAAIDAELTLEAGDDSPGSPCYLRIRAFVVDSVGHCGIEVVTATNGIPVERARSAFSIQCDAAQLNLFGAALGAWLQNPDESLDFSFTAD